MEKILTSFFLLTATVLFSAAGCKDNSPKIESIDFQFFHNVPGSCPTYFFSTLGTHESHIPAESSKTVIESFLKAHPEAAKVRISLQKTGKIVEHTCGDREANPKPHPFIEIEIFSITEI